MTVPEELLPNLLCWQDQLLTFRQDVYCIEIFTDATLEGWGAVRKNQIAARENSNVFAISIETRLVNRKFGNVHIQTIF